MTTDPLHIPSLLLVTHHYVNGDIYANDGHELHEMPCTVADAVEMWDTHMAAAMQRRHLVRALLAYANSDLDDLDASRDGTPYLPEHARHIGGAPHLLSRYVRAYSAQILDRNLLRQQLEAYLLVHPELVALCGSLIEGDPGERIYAGRTLHLDLPLRLTMDGALTTIASGAPVIALGDVELDARGRESVRCYIPAHKAFCSFHPSELLLTAGPNSGCGELLSCKPLVTGPTT